VAWNEAHGITPQSIRKNIGEIIQSIAEQDYVTVAPVKGADVGALVGKDLPGAIAELEKQMRAAAANLEFETAAKLRDEIKRLEARHLGLDRPGMVTPKAPRAADWKPEPMGPGGGGWDPAKRKAPRRARKGP
jgi:excinuclease ABC subunit B